MIESIDDLDSSSWEQEMDAYVARDGLLVVDGLNLAFRWKPRGKSVSSENNFAAHMVSMINSLAKSYSCKKVVFLSDLKGSKYRKHIHPLYKSDRKKQFANQTPEEAAASEAFFTYYQEVVIPLVAKNFTVLQFEGVEADDLACYIVEAFEGEDTFGHIWLISTDGDWDELLSEKCSRFAYSSRKEFTIDKFYEMKDCDSPEQFTHVKAIMGDLGDSVYGVPGIGAKRAFNLVREYGDVFGVIDALPIAGNQLFIKALNESEELLLLNLELVDLRSFSTEAINFADSSNLTKIDKIVQEIRNA